MGFKKTSDLIAISFNVTETGANTYTEDQVALQLDVLNNEIFVVLAADLDCFTPDAVPGTNTNVGAAITSTTSATLSTLSNTNTIAVSQLDIRAAGFVDGGVGFSRAAQESYTGDLDYISLIATNNFFVGIAGAGNLGVKQVNGRIFGYRARADASTYAALVQSEVLSA